MIKRLFVNNENSIGKKIENGDYSFFTAKGFFGFDDFFRFVKMCHIFISFILYLLILIALIKRKKKKYSVAFQLIGNILIINFIHTFSYILNWVTNINNAYSFNENNKNYKVGGLLIGNPKEYYFACQLQGFLILYSSLSQDISIIIFFYFINKPTIPSKIAVLIKLFIIGHLFPFIYSFIISIIGGIGQDDRYCYIQKFYFNQSGGYSIYKYFRAFIIITYTFRGINLGITIYLLYKINQYVKKQKIKKFYILKTFTILIVQLITISIGIIYRLSRVIFTDFNKKFSDAFICINNIDGIIFPLSYSISNGIYKFLFSKNNYNISTNSLITEDSEKIISDNSFSSSSHHSNDDSNTFPMIDLKEDNNFDLSIT